jgi:hypothetical protein
MIYVWLLAAAACAGTCAAALGAVVLPRTEHDRYDKVVAICLIGLAAALSFALSAAVTYGVARRSAEHDAFVSGCTQHHNSALANARVPFDEIGAMLGHAQLSITTCYAHHPPQRLVETAATAARAWRLLLGADDDRQPSVPRQDIL